MIEAMNVGNVGDYMLLRQHALLESYINDYNTIGLSNLSTKERVSDFLRNVVDNILELENNDDVTDVRSYRVSFTTSSDTMHKDIFIVDMNMNGLNIGFALGVNAGGLYYIDTSSHDITYLASFNDWNQMDKDNETLVDNYNATCKGNLKLIIEMVTNQSNMAGLINYGMISTLYKEDCKFITTSSPILGSDKFVLMTNVENFIDCQLLLVKLASDYSDESISDSDQYIVAYDSITDDIKLYPLSSPKDDINDISIVSGGTIKPIMVASADFTNRISNLIYYSVSDPVKEMYDDITEEAWELPINEYHFKDVTFGESISERKSTAVHTKVESVKAIPKKISIKYKELMKSIKGLKAKLNRRKDLKTYEDVTSRGYTDVYRQVMLFLVGIPLVAVGAFAGALLGLVIAIPLSVILKSKLKEARIEHISFIDEEIEQVEHKIAEAESNGDTADARKLMRIKAILHRNRSKIDRI